MQEKNIGACAQDRPHSMYERRLTSAPLASMFDRADNAAYAAYTQPANIQSTSIEQIGMALASDGWMVDQVVVARDAYNPSGMLGKGPPDTSNFTMYTTGTKVRIRIEITEQKGSAAAQFRNLAGLGKQSEVV